MYDVLPAMLLLSALLCQSALAQRGTRGGQGTGAQTPAAPAVASSIASSAASPTSPFNLADLSQTIVTHHQITLNGSPLAYTATAGMMPLKGDTGEVEAGLFYVAYTRDVAGVGQGANGNPAFGGGGINSGGSGGGSFGGGGSLSGVGGSVSSAGVDTHRPLVFAFNGGPGSASIWLHLGALGPRRVPMNPDGGLPPPPYHVEDNPQTWLDQADLVFLDPVGTGYSRPTKPEYGRKFWGVQGDIAAAGDFIRLYLTRNKRWGSPLFLAGESYGTTRAAGLSDYLVEHGIALNGIMLLSSVLNFETLEFARGNDLPYMLFLPTYTAAAFFHGKLPPAQSKDLNATLREAQTWAQTEYVNALAQGDRLTAPQRQAIIAKMAQYTGLSRTYLDRSDLRVDIESFCKELLRDKRRTVGRLDSRFIGMDSENIGQFPDFDPSMAAIRPPYTSAFNDYVRSELGFASDEEYYALGGGIKGPWDWGTRGQGYANVAPALTRAFTKNPYMRLFVAEGYYDLATPYFAAEYTLAHLGLDPSIRANITTAQYEAGHMMYIDTRSLAKLKADVTRFMQNALHNSGTPQSAVVGQSRK